MSVWIWIAAAAAVLAAVYAVWFGGRVQCRNCGFYVSRRTTQCPSCGCMLQETDETETEPES